MLPAPNHPPDLARLKDFDALITPESAARD